MERERGLALVSVLWALSILSLIAASMMSTGRLSAAMERNTLRRVQADRIAESAIALGILGLLDSRPERRSRVDGVSQDVMFASVRLQISIQDELGLIDLNHAGAELFRGLFRSAGLRESEAERLATRVIDWRTSAAARGPQGTGAADYERAGLSYAPRGGPFQSVDELRLVLGVAPWIFARVQPALTVYSQQPNVDQRLAPKEALLSLSGMEARQVDAILDERKSDARSLGGQGLSFGTAVVEPGIALNGRTFTIRARFTYRETTTEKRVVVRIGANRARTYMSMAVR